MNTEISDCGNTNEIPSSELKEGEKRPGRIRANQEMRRSKGKKQKNSSKELASVAGGANTKKNSYTPLPKGAQKGTKRGKWEKEKEEKEVKKMGGPGQVRTRSTGYSRGGKGKQVGAEEDKKAGVKKEKRRFVRGGEKKRCNVNGGGGGVQGMFGNSPCVEHW